MQEELNRKVELLIAQYDKGGFTKEELVSELGLAYAVEDLNKALNVDFSPQIELREKINRLKLYRYLVMIALEFDCVPENSPEVVDRIFEEYPRPLWLEGKEHLGEILDKYCAIEIVVLNELIYGKIDEL